MVSKRVDESAAIAVELGPELAILIGPLLSELRMFCSWLSAEEVATLEVDVLS